MSLKIIASKILSKSPSDIIDGDLIELEEAIKCCSIDELNELWRSEGYSLLMMAVKAGQVDIIRLLYPHFLNDYRADKLCVQLLKLALFRKQEEVAKVLLNFGVYLNADTQHAILLLACDNHEIMTILIERGIDINMIGYSLNTRRFDTCLHLSCRKGNLEMIQLLFMYGADANLHREGLHPPIVDACIANQIDAIRLLLAKGADINITEGMYGAIHLTPLARACEHGFVEVTRLLLEHGADVNATDSSGDTALIHTLRCFSPPYLECIHLLLEYGADVSIVNTDGYTALEYVDKNTEIAHMILNSQLERVLK